MVLGNCRFTSHPLKMCCSTADYFMLFLTAKGEWWSRDQLTAVLIQLYWLLEQDSPQNPPVHFESSEREFRCNLHLNSGIPCRHQNIEIMPLYK